MNFFIVRKKRSGSQKNPLFIVIRASEIRGAAKRNLLKRRIRPLFKNKKENDYMVVVKKGADMVSFDEMKKNIENQM